MATKKEINEFLKENNYTMEQMDKYWKDLYNINSKVSALTDIGKDWTELNISLIKQIPTQSDKDLKRIEEEKRKEDELKKKEEDKKYYEEHFEEIMCNKILNKEDLSEDELKRVVYDYEIESDYGENERWTRNVISICKLNGKYFSVNWNEGLTEMQPNDFYNQPDEVELKEYEKTITVREWIPVKK